MRMLRAVVAVVAVAGIGVTSARAQDYVEVRRTTSPAGVVLRDTIAGGLVGSAVAGGIILYEMGIQDNDDYDWGRTLAWGAVIGLGAGLIWGVVDATSGDYAARTIRSAHDGQSMSLDLRARDQSGKAVFPVVLGRF
ncbi:MAG TPA: hypothetical protein VFL83_13890 [Anaeromyxobacter sp.]|nr:hypothetical protein [Anaeromyxobacter sp.]